MIFLIDQTFEASCPTCQEVFNLRYDEGLQSGDSLLKHYKICRNAKDFRINVS